MKKPFTLITFAIAVGCSADTAFDPATLPGAYPLSRVDGTAMPANHVTQNGCTVTFTSGTLGLLAGSQASFQVAYTYTCPADPPGSGFISLSGTYAVSGTAIALALNTGSNNPVSFPMTAVVAGSSIDVQFVGMNQSLWADPHFTFGPRQPLP